MFAVCSVLGVSVLLVHGLRTGVVCARGGSDTWDIRGGFTVGWVFSCCRFSTIVLSSRAYMIYDRVI